MKRHSMLVGIPIHIELMELGSTDDADGPERWAFLFGDRMHLISQIVDGWTSEEHRYLQVRVQDGRRFMLRHDASTQRWTASALIRD
jgi:hypothetical protein